MAVGDRAACMSCGRPTHRHDPASIPGTFTVIAAKYQTPPAEPPPIVIEADATQRGPDDPDTLKAVQEAILRIVRSRPRHAAATAEIAAPEPDWMLWGRLRTTPSPVLVPPDSGRDGLCRPLGAGHDPLPGQSLHRKKTTATADSAASRRL